MPLSKRARALAGHRLPPPRLRPYALSLAPAVHEARWRVRIRRARRVSGDEHAARVGLRDIEEVIGCSLCGEPRMQPLFTPTARTDAGATTSSAARHAASSTATPASGRSASASSTRATTTASSPAATQAAAAALPHGHARLRHALRGRRRPPAARLRLRRGTFLEVADRRGFDAYGVDLSPEAVAYARLRPGGAHAHVGAPLDVPEIAAGGFDVVTLWSVLAHLPRPIDDLRMLRGLLAPGGVC